MLCRILVGVMALALLTMTVATTRALDDTS
jgi:hypothetical protein